MRAERGDTDINLRAFNHPIQSGRDLFPHLRQRFTRNVEFADVRVKERSVSADPVTGVAGAAVLPGRGGKLGVIPDGDHQYIPRPDAIFPAR
ncbi:hypothetical protein D3C87_2000760 [compost metagenome]